MVMGRVGTTRFIMHRPRECKHNNVVRTSLGFVMNLGVLSGKQAISVAAYGPAKRSCARTLGIVSSKTNMVNANCLRTDTHVHVRTHKAMPSDEHSGARLLYSRPRFGKLTGVPGEISPPMICLDVWGLLRAVHVSDPFTI